MNDQVHRAGGPTRVNVEKSNTVNEGNSVEKPKNEPAPVQRLVRPHSGDELSIDCGKIRGIWQSRINRNGQVA